MRKITLTALIVSITLSLCLIGCASWEYDVEKRGIHFKKISQSKAGTIIGYMNEIHDIQGFPCEKGWIHFRKDWQLLSFQLSRDFMFKGTTLPAHTWLHFYYDGQPGHICSFPYDYEVQGYTCSGSGGYKGTSTAFYDSGALRSFYPPEDITVDGISCDATLLVNVNLYEDGNIKSCKLAEDGQYYRV